MNQQILITDFKWLRPTWYRCACICMCVSLWRLQRSSSKVVNVSFVISYFEHTTKKKTSTRENSIRSSVNVAQIVRLKRFLHQRENGAQQQQRNVKFLRLISERILIEIDSRIGPWRFSEKSVGCIDVRRWMSNVKSSSSHFCEPHFVLHWNKHNLIHFGCCSLQFIGDYH